MTDQEIYQTFRDKLADFVLVAINRDGKKLQRKPSDDTVCPFGCIPGITMNRPTGAMVRLSVPEWKNLPYMAASAFTDGFDGIERASFVGGWGVDRYYDLGAEYARRFG